LKENTPIKSLNLINNDKNMTKGLSFCCRNVSVNENNQEISQKDPNYSPGKHNTNTEDFKRESNSSEGEVDLMDGLEIDLNLEGKTLGDRSMLEKIHEDQSLKFERNDSSNISNVSEATELATATRGYSFDSLSSSAIEELKTKLSMQEETNKKQMEAMQNQIELLQKPTSASATQFPVSSH